MRATTTEVIKEVELAWTCDERKSSRARHASGGDPVEIWPHTTSDLEFKWC